MIGTSIGNFRIVTELGSGGMGQVYFAEHALMGRRAAVKVIRPELATDAVMVDRFMKEARAVNAVGHPNIVEITDCGRVADTYYIMMEMLDGETLEERLERTPMLDEKSAVDITLQIADALFSAHKLGIVHRDLKPENIYLTTRGEKRDFVKLLDFGIAKLMHVQEAGGRTKTGTILGTPAYMSPEQCLGDVELDHRSDIYSLGCVLYRMLTGSMPFEADSFTRCLIAHCYEAPKPPSSLNPGLSEHLQESLLRMLAKKPEERFPTMQELSKALHPAPAAKAPAAAAAASPIVLGPRPAPANSAVITVEERREPPPDPEQSQRVAGKLARIVIERLHSGRLKLPTLPHAAMRCLEQLRDPNHSARQLAETLSADPVLVPQVLRHANSAASGGGGRVRTLEHAISRLGGRELRAILLTVSAQQVFQSRNPAIRRAFSELWDHSLVVAQLSQAIAKNASRAVNEQSYLSGLLHDIGKPVCAVVLLEAERTAADSPDAWLGLDSWQDVVSECHRDVGTALARAWLLPEDVLGCIAGSDRFAPGGMKATVNVVCLANAMAKQAGVYSGTFDAERNEALIKEGKSVLGLSDEAMEELKSSMQSSLEAHKTMSVAL